MEAYTQLAFDLPELRAASCCVRVSPRAERDREYREALTPAEPIDWEALESLEVEYEPAA